MESVSFELSETVKVKQAICKICMQPVIAGQPIHGATLNHWECESRSDLSTEAVIARMDQALANAGLAPKRKPPVPVGEGPTAQKLKTMIEAAFKVQLEASEVKDLWFWIQDPAYRGPRWDLAGWGGHAVVDGQKTTFHSWATMTQCVKSGGVKLVADGLEWDVYPRSQIENT